MSIQKYFDAAQVKSLGYEPIVVLSQADRECKDCRDNTLGDFAALNDLRAKVSSTDCPEEQLCLKCNCTMLVLWNFANICIA